MNLEVGLEKRFFYREIKLFLSLKALVEGRVIPQSENDR